MLTKDISIAETHAKTYLKEFLWNCLIKYDDIYMVVFNFFSHFKAHEYHYVKAIKLVFLFNMKQFKAG